MRWLLAIVILAAAALPARAASAILGIWDIEIIAGTANGDVGVIVFREDEDGKLVADLEYHDADARVTATEICEVREIGRAVSITCTVLTPKTPDYWPDDFNLRIVDPNRMVGRVHSATSGPAIFTRREVPMS